MIKGHAELHATRNYFKKLKIDKKLVRCNGFFCNLPIAIGTYLGDISNEHTLAYMDTISYGLSHGVNFLDTAINYREMRSERDIGMVLEKLILIEKKLKREEIIVSSKSGYLYGDYSVGLTPIKYLRKVLIPKGIVTMDDINVFEEDGHTLVPEFYDESIEKSKVNLGLATIDIYYIHNPEVSLYVLGSDLFYYQLHSLFKSLENQVDKRNIRFYGFATWYGFLEDPDSKWYISLEKVMKIAKSLGGSNHHFRFIQFPFNKINCSGNTKKNQMIDNKYYTLIEAANKFNLTVTTSVPLNQSQDLSQNKLTQAEMLNYVINTPGIQASMVGTKTTAHLLENLKTINLKP